LGLRARSPRALQVELCETAGSRLAGFPLPSSVGPRRRTWFNELLLLHPPLLNLALSKSAGRRRVLVTLAGWSKPRIAQEGKNYAYKIRICTWIPGTLEAEVGGSRVEASLGYIHKLFLKKVYRIYHVLAFQSKLFHVVLQSQIALPAGQCPIRNTSLFFGWMWISKTCQRVHETTWKWKNMTSCVDAFSI
jgi:hypothetical protein